MPTLFEPSLTQVLKEDKAYLETTALPIITVSATFREDLKRLHGLPNNETTRDIVFSRAHYSMAIGVATQAWGSSINPEKAWVVDPTNYVSHKDWFSVNLTEEVGMTLARHPLLKIFKDFLDKFGRQKMPILSSITPPLLYLTQKMNKPILSFHIAAGNILATQGKKVVQVITDPHVRDEYVENAGKANMRFCVFDEETKLDFLEKAAIHGKTVDSTQVVVTGPPIDPRIIAARRSKYAWRSGSLKLCITTGGLGTNKLEIKQLLEQLLPELRRRPSPYQLIIYTGTHADIAQMVEELAAYYRVAIEDTKDIKAKLRLLHHPQIVDANELLIKYAFPWADGFITKPSGDMAYDAAASGAFLLTLPEWGEWEENIRKIFEQRGISRKAALQGIVPQLQVLQNAKGKSQSWVEQAMNNACQIDRLFLNGAKQIIKAYESFAEESK